jgi:nitrite reductase/ring-hydroxylating ferredoxin subunit
MYPNEMCKWTPVALSTDVPAGTVVPAIVPDGQMALWRSQSGQLAASGDRCPHRGMRLSQGYVRGEALSCIYHGWSFAHDGHCKRIPAHPDLEPPETINTRNKTVKEVGGLIWIEDEPSGTAPPDISGFIPLRSMTLAAGIDSIEKAADTKAVTGALSLTFAETPVRILPVAQASGETRIHILVDERCTPETRIAVSRAAELFRLDAERAEKEEGAK